MTTTTTDAVTIINDAANSLGPGLAQLAAAAVAITVVAVAIAYMVKLVRG
jgi:hypothetical protein